MTPVAVAQFRERLQTTPVRLSHPTTSFPSPRAEHSRSMAATNAEAEALIPQFQLERLLNQGKFWALQHLF